MNVLRKRATTPNVSETALSHSFIFSNAKRDRYNDSINVRGWDLSEFLPNPIALLNHDPNMIIGKWTDVRVEGDNLKGRLKLAPEGTSRHADEARKLIDAGILRACSVGFIPIESKPRADGVDYIKQKLIECSVVAIPAHSGAILEEVKSLGVSKSMIDTLFCKPPYNGSLAERQAHAAASLARMDERTRRNLADYEENRRLARMDSRTRANLADYDANRREAAERKRKLTSASRASVDPRLREIIFNANMNAEIRSALRTNYGDHAFDAAEEFTRETLERIAAEHHHAKSLREAAAVREYFAKLRRIERE